MLGASIPLGGHGGNFVWMDARKLIPLVGGETWLWLLIHSTLTEKCIVYNTDSLGIVPEGGPNISSHKCGNCRAEKMSKANYY